MWKATITAVVFIAASLNGCSSEATRLPANPELESLIDQLASQNPAPKLGGPMSEPALDKLYDVKKQQLVEDAYLKLGQIGYEAFPYLINHLEDDRYSHTESGAIYFNVTVGDASRQLIVRAVNVVSIYCGPGKADFVDYFKLEWDGDIQRWWREKKHLSLREMQIEALNFQIQKSESLHLSSHKLQLAHAALETLLKSDKPFEEPFSPNGVEIIDALLFDHRMIHK